MECFLPAWIVRVPARPGPGVPPDAREDYGIIDAPNDALARKFAAPIVRWEAARIEAVPCEDPTGWMTVAERVRYDALVRMSRSLLNERDRRFIVAMDGKRPRRS